MVFRESVEGLPRPTFGEPLLRRTGHPRHQDDDGQFRARVREVRRGQVDLRIAGEEQHGDDGGLRGAARQGKGGDDLHADILTPASLTPGVTGGAVIHPAFYETG